MTRKEFKEKYAEVIKAIQAATPEIDDRDEATDKLISSIRGHFGEAYTDGTGTHVFETYPGIPEGFDWDQAYADYKELIKG